MRDRAPGTPRVNSYLSGAKAQVDAQLAAVDKLLVESGYEVGTQPATDEEGGGGALDNDPGALYNRALEMYGVNADATSTQEKIAAIKQRAEERRKEFAATQEALLDAYLRPNRPDELS